MAVLLSYQCTTRSGLEYASALLPAWPPLKCSDGPWLHVPLCIFSPPLTDSPARWQRTVFFGTGPRAQNRYRGNAEAWGGKWIQQADAERWQELQHLMRPSYNNSQNECLLLIVNGCTSGPAVCECWVAGEVWPCYPTCLDSYCFVSIICLSSRISS